MPLTNEQVIRWKCECCEETRETRMPLLDNGHPLQPTLPEGWVAYAELRTGFGLDTGSVRAYCPKHREMLQSGQARGLKLL
jgi:hypothetical protein